MSEPTSQTPSGRDEVFNDETCRALRRNGRDVGRALAVFGTFAIILPLAYALPALAWSPLSNFALKLAGSTALAVATVAVMKRVNLMPTPETFRQMERSLTREAHALAGDPQAIESRLEETSGPTARPELAFGLAPEECATVFLLPLMALFVAVSEFEGLAVILSIAACIAASGVLFALVNHSPAKVNTYPPEDPPHDRS